MVIVNRESGDRLKRKWEFWSLTEKVDNIYGVSFMEEVRMMVVNGESGCRLTRKLEWWLWSLTEKVDFVYRESVGH